MGWPVMHSRSPTLHNYLFAQYGLAGTYVPLAIEPDDLESALRALAPLGFSGCNLTIPHKERALAIVDSVDPVARRIGAISCVAVRPDGSLAGTNNDGYGFVHNILQHQPEWRADAGPIAVIGAGGGARAVICSLADRGAREIRVIDRTSARGQALARELGRLSRRSRGKSVTARWTARPCWSTRPARGWSVSRPSISRSKRSPIPRWSATSSTSRSETPLLAAARRRAAIAPSTVSGCCSTRRGPPGRRGSAWSRRSPPELRATIEATLTYR